MASEMYVGAPIVVGEWIYAPHPDGVARISLAGAPTTFIPLDHQLAFGEYREVHHLAVIGNQELRTQDARPRHARGVVRKRGNGGRGWHTLC